VKARLFARFGPEDGLEVVFAGEATIGRGKENSASLRSPDVSQRHARVFFDEQTAAYWVEDLGSLNGTRVDGEPVRGRRRLGKLHMLGFGATAELFFLELDLDPEVPEAVEEEPKHQVRVDEGKQTRVDGETPILPQGLSRPPTREGTRVDSEAPVLPPGLRAPQSEAASGSATRIEEHPVELPRGLAGDAQRAPDREPAGRFALEIEDEAGGRFVLREGDNVVGRSGGARVTLRNRELSRKHATLRVEGNRVWVRDEGSRNHTYVGDQQISEEVELQVGSELHFGRLAARLVSATAGAEESE
jgi:pSer/pThr/pTyr-binding forkhead associated (FHA) protein